MVRKVSKLKIGLLLIVLIGITPFSKSFAQSETTNPEAYKESLKAIAREIITEQVEAFKSLDLDKAYSFASPMIKSMFASPDIFGRMVQSGYPMIWSPREFKFLNFTLFNGSIVQRIMFIDTKEDTYLFDYELRKYQDGLWLINGVYPVENSASGA